MQKIPTTKGQCLHVSNVSSAELWWTINKPLSLPKYSWIVPPDRPDLYRISLMVCHVPHCLLPFCLFHAKQYLSECSVWPCKPTVCHDKHPCSKHLLSIKCHPLQKWNSRVSALQTNHGYSFLTINVASSWPLPTDQAELQEHYALHSISFYIYGKITHVTSAWTTFQLWLS